MVWYNEYEKNLINHEYLKFQFVLETLTIIRCKILLRPKCEY